MADNELAKLQGIDTVAYVRPMKNAATESGKLVPFQTGLSFDPSRDSDSTATKDGAVSSSSSVKTDLEVDFINNTSAIADAMYDSLFDGEALEVWILNRKRKNAQGQYFAWYMRATVSEDSNDNDPDDLSTREVSFAVDGTPKRGWVTLDADAQEELDYVFRGLAPATDNAANGNGVAWGASDAGVNTGDAPKA